MSDHSFTTSFSVDQTPKQAFEAINNVRGWWSGEIEGDTHELGDEFTYRYKDVHRSKQRLIEVVPEKRVVWLVLDAHLNFIEDSSEWNGTKIVFEILKGAGRKSASLTRDSCATTSASTPVRAPGAPTSTAACEA